jgi:hypothetical protein
MEGMSEMHHTMSHMHHVSSSGIVGQALGFAGRLSAELLIVLTSAPVPPCPRGAGASPRASRSPAAVFGAANVAILSRIRSQCADMMTNCMNTGTGALTIAGIRLSDAALALTALLLVLLAAVAAVAVVRFLLRRCAPLQHSFLQVDAGFIVRPHLEISFSVFTCA